MSLCILEIAQLATCMRHFCTEEQHHEPPKAVNEYLSLAYHATVIIFDPDTFACHADGVFDYIICCVRAHDAV